MNKVVIAKSQDIATYDLYNLFIGNKKEIQDLISQVIEHGYDYNSMDSNDNTLLTLACQYNLSNLVKHLLKFSDIEINTFNRYGLTALMYAIKNQNLEIIYDLLNKPKINISARNKDGDSPLMLAYETNNIIIIRQLLNHPNLFYDS